MLYTVVNEINSLQIRPRYASKQSTIDQPSSRPVPLHPGNEPSILKYLATLYIGFAITNVA